MDRTPILLLVSHAKSSQSLPRPAVDVMRPSHRDQADSTKGLCGTASDRRRAGAGRSRASFLAESREIGGHEVPVDEAGKEGLDVFGPQIAVVDVVGVLPDVHGQEGRLAVLQGQVGVARSSSP